LRESEVLSAIRKFLADRKVKYYRQKGSGPDILLVGDGIIETKGKGFDAKRAFEQFVRYPLTYSSLQVAIPADALSIATLFALFVIEKSLKTASRPPIGVYLITKVSEARYRIRLFASSQELFESVSSRFEEKLRMAGEETADIEERIQKNVDIMQNMEKEIQAILEEDVRSLYSHEVVL